jgi:2-oxoglutarate ferredoxin oxidoreductase subunit delta
MRKVEINEDYCKGCELCVSVCPKHVLAISSHLNATGYHPAELVDEANCTMCAFCARMCPDAAIEVWLVAAANSPEKERKDG